MASRIKLTLCCLVLCQAVQAQSFSEWFKQKSTQKKYLAQQIAALQIYGGYLKKGYDIAGDGLSVIRGFKNGEFDLHRLFFASLKAVNPVIRDHPKAAEVLADYSNIRLLFSGLQKLELPAPHRDYLDRVQNTVLKYCDNDLQELETVITPGKAEMTDDQRIARLEKIHAAMQDKLDFSRHFAGEIRGYVSGRDNEQRSINRLKDYYEIKN